MSENYTVRLMGVLTYDKCLKLSGQHLSAKLADYAPSVYIADTGGWGNVIIDITFEDYDSCPHCHSTARKAQMENKKAQYIVSLGVLSRDGDIISPDALHLSTFPSGILDENGVVVGEITDVAIDGNKLILTIEHCDEFVERLKKRGTWTITSAVKSSDC